METLDLFCFYSAPIAARCPICDNYIVLKCHDIQHSFIHSCKAFLGAPTSFKIQCDTCNGFTPVKTRYLKHVATGHYHEYNPNTDTIFFTKVIHTDTNLLGSVIGEFRILEFDDNAAVIKIYTTKPKFFIGKVIKT